MKLTSMRSHPLITGTLLLTLSGLLSRLIGFFFRIFLSQRIGAEGMGIYQLTFPIHVLTISLTSSAIQTAISRFVAQAVIASDNPGADSGKSRSFCNDKCYLTAGLTLSLSLSVCCMVFLYRFAGWIAVSFLEEPRCAPLLQILSFTIPFGAIHACINGYFYGLKKTFVPAASQLLEQAARVASVWLFFEISMEKHNAISLSLVTWGMVVGELAATLFSVSFLRRKKNLGSRLPGQLRLYGYTNSESLSVYGILTGMALPMVLFPSVLTNSVSVMLLPAIAEAQEKKEHRYILTLIKRTCFYSLSLGFGCTMLFLFLGRWMGQFLF